MTNKNVTYGILTNSKQYRFFQRRVDASNVDVQKVDDVALNDLPDNLTLFNAYTKDAIETGKSEDFFRRINKLREARQTLEADKDDLGVKLSNLLADEVSDSISSLAETQAKEMIDRVVADIKSEIDADNGHTDEKNVDTGSRSPDPTANHIVGQIKREEIEGDNDAKVAVFPTKVSGVEFLRENNAWGFVKMAQDPEFVAMYVSEDVQEIKYVARFKDTVPATEADTARPKEAYFESGSDEAQAGFDPDQQVVGFEPGSLYELEDPVPFETKFPMSLQYTTLGALRTAETTDDML
jgi:hypothetical protein